jgi:hypothetical protein
MPNLALTQSQKNIQAQGKNVGTCFDLGLNFMALKSPIFSLENVFENLLTSNTVSS